MMDFGTDCEIAVIVESNPAIVLLDNVKRDDLFKHIRIEIEAFQPDLMTSKGRAAIKSFAYKITQTKTAVDEAGKNLTEEWRTKTNAVNEARREAKTELTALAESVRKPLTDWEDTETLRVFECREVIQWLKSSMNVFMDDTADAVRDRGMMVYQTELAADKYRDYLAEAKEAKAAAIASLKASLARLVKEEADRAELARLQQAEADRLAKEAEQRAADEQRQRDEEAAVRAEEARIAAEKLNQELMTAAEERAANQAKWDAEQKAITVRDAEQKRIDEERRETQSLHDEALAAERLRVQEAEQRENDRIATVKREADERSAREADQAHRTAVQTAAKEALISHGLSEELSVKIVLAILAGNIPFVKMEF